jgi:hypothetical protein
MSVLAVALKRRALSRGTVPSAVPAGHPVGGGANGLGTFRTDGTRRTVSTTPSASAVKRSTVSTSALSSNLPSVCSRCGVQSPTGRHPGGHVDAGDVVDASIKFACIENEGTRE